MSRRTIWLWKITLTNYLVVYYWLYGIESLLEVKLQYHDGQILCTIWSGCWYHEKFNKKILKSKSTGIFNYIFETFTFYEILNQIKILLKLELTIFWCWYKRIKECELPLHGWLCNVFTCIETTSSPFFLFTFTDTWKLLSSVTVDSFCEQLLLP